MKTTTSIDYSKMRGGYYFVTKEHGDCLYFDTLEQAEQGARESWGKDVDIYLTGRTRSALRKQEQAMQVAS